MNHLSNFAKNLLLGVITIVILAGAFALIMGAILIVAWVTRVTGYTGAVICVVVLFALFMTVAEAFG